MLLDALIRLAVYLLVVQAAVTGRDDDDSSECDEHAVLLGDHGDLLEPLMATPVFRRPTFTPLPPVRTSTTTSRAATTSTPGRMRTSAVFRSLISTSSSASASSSASSSASVASPSSVVSPSPTSSAIAVPTPRSSSSKLVFAHHLVGFTYSYTVSTWANDISLAASKGIDAFALNVGSDAWEPGQVASAYQAAQSLSTSFKLFLSFDMTSIACGDTSQVQLLRDYITNYASHPNQLTYNGAVFVSAFAGDGCTFGAGSVNQGWTNTIKSGLPATYFVPAFFNTQNFGGLSVLDGAFAWNSGWPMQDTNITFDQDQQYISALGGRSYMAAVSPWFFTHYGPDSYNKNFIYRGDDWLLAQRWELLVQNRDAVQFVEVNTWNDYSESHYVGPVDGSQPGSQAWVDGFDHQGWLDLIAYYIAAFKTGAYPAVTRDRTFLWARLYPAAAGSPDPVAKPTNWQWTEDYLWAVVQLTAPATVTLACGGASASTDAPAGTSWLKLAFPGAGCAVTSAIARGGAMVSTFAPSGFQYSLSPPSYNFNAFVAASP